MSESSAVAATNGVGGGVERVVAEGGASTRVTTGSKGSGESCSSVLISTKEPRVGVLLSCSVEVLNVDFECTGVDVVPSSVRLAILVWVDDVVPLLFLALEEGLECILFPLDGRERMGTTSSSPLS